MKKLLATTLITTLIAASSIAVAGPGRGGCGGGGYNGPGAGHHGGRGDMIAHLDRVVSLTDEQKAALQDIQDDMRAERGSRDWQGKAMMKLDSTAADYQDQVNALAEAAAERARERTLRHGEKHAQVQAILTAEQRAKLREFHEERASFRQKWNK